MLSWIKLLWEEVNRACHAIRQRLWIMAADVNAEIQCIISLRVWLPFVLRNREAWITSPRTFNVLTVSNPESAPSRLLMRLSTCWEKYIEVISTTAITDIMIELPICFPRSHGSPAENREIPTMKTGNYDDFFREILLTKNSAADVAWLTA